MGVETRVLTRICDGAYAGFWHKSNAASGLRASIAPFGSPLPSPSFPFSLLFPMDDSSTTNHTRSKRRSKVHVEVAPPPKPPPPPPPEDLPADDNDDEEGGVTRCVCGRTGTPKPLLCF